MLRRDYIMKLIQQFLDSLFLLLNEKDMDDAERLRKLEVFYKEYLGEAKDFYHQNSVDEILKFLEEKYGGEELIHRVEMLSEILYNESMLMATSDEKTMLLQKTMLLLMYLENNSNTFSVVRKGKMELIEKELKG